MIILNKRRRGHTMAHKGSKPTNSLASGWRAAQRDAKKQVRIEETRRELDRDPRSTDDRD